MVKGRGRAGCPRRIAELDRSELGVNVKLTILSFLLVSLSAFADAKSVRWTGAEDPNPDLLHILDVIKAKTGIELSLTDLMPLEDRKLATSHYTMYAQIAGGLPVSRQSLRIWRSLGTGDVIQVEARVDTPPPVTYLKAARAMTSDQTMDAVRRIVKANPDDPHVRGVEWKDEIEGTETVRFVKVKGKHGTYSIRLSTSGTVLSSEYKEFPQADQEISVPVRVYPFYEEVDGAPNSGQLDRIESELRYLKAKVQRPVDDPYAALKKNHYVDDKFDPLLGLTVAGRKKGYWAMGYVKSLADALLNQVPATENSFANGGIVLEGRYATVSLYPDAVTKFKPLAFTPAISGHFLPFWQAMAGNPDHEEMIPSASLRGRPITSLDDAWMRPNRRLANHDATSYINDGFDEVQVYWAITQMFESLQSSGFTDPDLSTRPFHAFLFDPDISYKDNAFYTDDTINFTTYSGNQQNMARDNSTIWHELGHGVMDRLMGDHIRLADTGGLSEGMADFVAQLVLNDVSGGAPFPGKEGLRIFNNMGFHLTNEVHDDGEAYGGAMNDLLRGAMAKYGRPGLEKVTDLTLEAMRLTRNHPGLTATDWFEHMLFADSLGSRNRRPGELKNLILQALNGRNFVFGAAQPASFTLKNGADEVTSTGPGSRPRPIVHKIAETDTVSYQLQVSLKSTGAYHFKYPVKVQVELRNGPLQGAIHWVGEEKNPLVFTLNSEADTVSVPLSATGKCDEINRPDGSCVDFAYVQIFNQGATRPSAKKRFYLRIYKK